ncbi:MAG TPA: type II secretion system protein [Verrucomicrobiae bacterium]|nr:type II secretion system protein [Verrucomicrobiae bacterium]
MKLLREPFQCEQNGAGLPPAGARCSSRSWVRARSAFTLVEIALSVAIIGFALVAIIGVLPAGLNVQKENREETIIVHDANYFLDAIRSGARGLDDLTNYVESITVVQTRFDAQTNILAGPRSYQYSYTNYSIDGTAQGEPDLSLNTLTNGQRIIGLLSTPKYVFETPTPGPSAFRSNYVVAYIRALSGPAIEKAPQQNAAIRDLSFRYRLVSEVVPYRNWTTNWTDFQYAMAIGLSTNEVVARSNYWQTARMLQNNLHEVRLIFRWPVKANGEAGSQRQVFRTTLGGAFLNEANTPRWFVQPGVYVATNQFAL